MAQCIRPCLAVDLTQSFFVKKRAGPLLVKGYDPPPFIAFLYFADVLFAQRLYYGVRVFFITAERRFIDTDGPAMTAVVFAAISNALKLRDKPRGIYKCCHVVFR
ncbi:hypothetical protein DBR09_03910 [Aeromonas sp. HMWF016]|nr:hypothetical protein DBR09_03910 [Aeromonas sp. HMWF016]